MAFTKELESISAGTKINTISLSFLSINHSTDMRYQKISRQQKKTKQNNDNHKHSIKKFILKNSIRLS